MEEQTLQSVPEVLAGNLVEETEIEIVTEEEVKKKEDRTEEDDEEFYERIEAPKFVDFTKPYTVRTDDRYWFCSRVGCDRKHEEEINPEEISKNFVLRVLAARSPNIKLRKALNRENSSLKCPLSAPAKPSKPRIPKLAIGSLFSDQNGDLQRKTGPCSKVGSTPVAKTRQVAAKYMTTPRNKMCHINPNSFRSVQNPKTTTVDVTKNRTVAKALVFRSPKKVIVLKKSVELHTPLTKICEGMKKLAIASQKKTLNGSTNKIKKPEIEESARRQLKICRSEKKSKDLASLKAAKTRNKKNPTQKCQDSNYQVVDVKVSDGFASEFSKKEDLHPCETSDASNSNALKAEMNDLSSVEDKVNMVSDEDHSNEVNDLSNVEDKENMVSVENHSNEVDDGKENSHNPQDNNRSNNKLLGDKIHIKELYKKNKVGQTVGSCVMKCKKTKPTSIKPFRLRTDERGILKEAILEKKFQFHAPEKEIVKDSSVIKRTYRIPKNEKFSKSDNHGKETILNTARTKRSELTQQRSMTSLKTRSQRMPGQQLSVIEEKSSKLPNNVMVEANKSRVVSAARSTSRGKRPLTVAKEPNFHTSHLPRTCSKKIA